MHNTARALINLAALRHNLGVVRMLCPRSRVMAMVKADAYGHGLLRVASALSTADGFAVARLSEALALRKAGVEQRILLLGTLLDVPDLALCSEQNIDVVAHDQFSVNLIVAQARRTPLRVWLKLDSGMHRLGLHPTAFVEADQKLSRHTGVLELVHMTHFSDACNQDIIEKQMSYFFRYHMMSSQAPVSIANSAALIARTDTHCDWVRPGIMLYGDDPVGVGSAISLLPAMTLSAHLIAIREIGPGESVGYNARWTSPRVSRIGTVGVGYGDGYPRHARNGTPVWIDGHLASLVGQVSMDSLTVDLTECPQIRLGDRAILWGPQLPVATIADSASTISYELFTSIQPRVTRDYSD
ncbi:alanine racemase 1 [Steroidobacter agaridevorans]|uniref:Alanine racemase n=1 Tax=Steroidobacter agaridevorans TaxID=2695856 RepID=A0A829YK53_9GAMM|nr:alanine racemase [Steroidobacter agaridevorans]GFE83695.1 alanine racemase 1 [Steroidobacter agaridevorans]